jgi:hypothetical protein
MPIKVAESRVEPTVLPSARFRVSPGPAAFGATEAGSVGQFGQQVERVGRIEAAEEEARLKEEEKVRAEYGERVDKLRATELVNKYTDWQREQKPNYLSRTGINAIDVTNDAIKDDEDIRRSIAAEAANDNVREKFATKVSARREAYLDSIKTHQTNEFFKTERTNAEAQRDNSINVMADINSSDLDRFLATEDLKDSLEILTQGKPAEVVKNIKSETWSSFHAERVNALAPLNAKMAQEYFNEHQKEMLPDAREELQGVLNTETTLQDSHAMAEQISTEVTDEAEWIDAARSATYTGTKEEQVEKMDATIKRLETKKDQLKQRRVEAQKEAFLTGLDQVDAAETLEEALEIAERVVDPIDREKVRKHANARFKKQKDGDIPTDLNVYADAWEEFNAGRLTTTRELNQYSGDLSTAHYNTLNTAIQNRSASLKGAKVPQMDYTTAQRAYMVQKDIDTYSPKDNGIEFMQLYEELNQASIQKGSTLTQVEANDLTATTIASGELSTGWIWSDKMTRIEADQAGKMHIWLPVLNADDIDQGKEKRDISGWTFINLGVSDPSDELMSMVKKEGIMKIELSGAQTKRYNKLIKAQQDKK